MLHSAIYEAPAGCILVVDGVYVSKARIINESAITPATRIIQNVGIGSTTIFVQSVRPLFDDKQENYTGADLNLVISDENTPKVAAGATVIVSDTGTNGYGYKYNFEHAQSNDGTIILPPLTSTPAVFELKNPNENIQGRVR